MTHTSPLITCASDDGFQDCMSDSEDTDLLMIQDSVALERHMKTVGIRDGLEVGKEETLQQGFDEGYALGASRSFRFGQLRGALGTAVACGLVQSDVITQAKVCLLKLRELEIASSACKDKTMDNKLLEKTVEQTESVLTRLGIDLSTSQTSRSM